MKIWLSKTSTVPLHEQLRTQVVLGIVSGDLPPDERLPSTSSIGRRFGIHPNTVRAAYRALAEAGWVDRRPGSGFFIRNRESDVGSDPELELDRLIATIFRVARDRGYSLDEIGNRVGRWLAVQPPDRIAVIEPDVELRAILIDEIQTALSVPVVGFGVQDCRRPNLLTGALPVALYDRAEDVRAALTPGIPCVVLHSSSVADLLAAETQPAPDALITVASRWPEFVRLARTFLGAVGIGDEALNLRDARQRGWNRGLDRASLIVTDSALVRRLPAGYRTRVFPIISRASLAELLHRFSG